MTYITISYNDAVPLLQKEFDRITANINKRQEDILQIHFKQRNEKLSKVSIFLKCLGVKPKLITLEQAKTELETYPLNIRYFEVNGKDITYSMSTSYAINIGNLLVTAKTMVNQNISGSLHLDIEDVQFLTWN